MRGTLKAIGDFHLELGPAWCRDSSVPPGARVTVSLVPEGPQFESLPTDFKAALGAEPEARRFFESLATFYRNGYMRWIEGAKRPNTRSERIAATVVALKAGKRER